VVAERRLPNDLGKIIGFLSTWREVSAIRSTAISPVLAEAV